MKIQNHENPKVPVPKPQTLIFQTLFSEKYSVQNHENPKVPVSKPQTLIFQTLFSQKYSVQNRENSHKSGILQIGIDDYGGWKNTQAYYM